MRALTLWQPWASLIAVDAKRHETRSWATTHRGKLAIHAAKRPPPADLPARLTDLCVERFGADWRTTLPRGAVVALADVVDCVPAASAKPDPLDAQCGDFASGRFAWRLENVVLCDPPIPTRGYQGLWTWRERDDGGL